MTSGEDALREVIAHGQAGLFDHYRTSLVAGADLYMARAQVAEPTSGLELSRQFEQATLADFEVLLSDPETPDPITEIARRRGCALARGPLRQQPEAAGELLWKAYAREISMLDGYKTVAYGPGGAQTAAVRSYCDQLASVVAWEVATSLYGDPQAEQVATAPGLYAKIGTGGDPELHWIGMKLARLHSELSDARFTLDILSQFDALSEQELAELAKENDQLWTSAQALRKYSVASVVAPTNLAGATQWSVISGRDMRAKVRESLEINMANAELQDDFILDVQPERYALEYAKAVFTATNGSFVDSDPTIEPLNIGGNHLGSHLRIDAKPLVEGGPNNTATYILNRRGEVTTLTGVPLRGLCEQTGCVDAYEQLRSELLALHFDLVVPSYVMKSMATSDREAAEANPEWRVKDRLRYLVIARRKYLQANVRAVRTSLRTERAAWAQSHNGTHQVNGHVRELPETHRASVEAREWAWAEDRRILAPFGETWVHTYQAPNIRAKTTGPRRAVPVAGRYATKLAERDKSSST